MVGSGKASWAVRGVQLGGAIGARVVSAPSDDDLRWADVVVLVKRQGQDWAPLVHRFGKPIVWDAVDFWRQPEENGLDEAEAKALLVAQIESIRPALVIGATEAMAEAAGGAYLPHHSWKRLTPAATREIVTTVGYEGKRKHLGRWGRAVQQECDRRGWTFAINPPDLRAMDLLVSFRDGEWDGWMCQEWKSGVKLVNAMAAGRPVITQPTAAFRELAPVGTALVSIDALRLAFDRWTEPASREYAVGQARARSLTLDQVAARYRLMLQDVAKAKAA